MPEDVDGDDLLKIYPHIDPENDLVGVAFEWGPQSGLLPPGDARDHALTVMQTAIAAEIDACLFKWAHEKLGLDSEQAIEFVQTVRKDRAVRPLVSCTMNMGDEHLRPETAREYAKFYLAAAASTEAEAHLVAFLMQTMNLQPGLIDQLIQEFRAMRGAHTIWFTRESEEAG